MVWRIPEVGIVPSEIYLYHVARRRNESHALERDAGHVARASKLDPNQSLENSSMAVDIFIYKKKKTLLKAKTIIMDEWSRRNVRFCRASELSYATKRAV